MWALLLCFVCIASALFYVDACMYCFCSVLYVCLYVSLYVLLLLCFVCMLVCVASALFCVDACM